MGQGGSAPRMGLIGTSPCLADRWAYDVLDIVGLPVILAYMALNYIYERDQLSQSCLFFHQELCYDLGEA
jgi:hypothetical protein